MHTALRFLLAGVLLVFALFCIFGFLASFEPANNAIIWRIGYATIGLAAFAGVIWLTLVCGRRD